MKQTLPRLTRDSFAIATLATTVCVQHKQRADGELGTHGFASKAVQRRLHIFKPLVRVLVNRRKRRGKERVFLLLLQPLSSLLRELELGLSDVGVGVLLFASAVDELVPAVWCLERLKIRRQNYHREPGPGTRQEGDGGRGVLALET